MGSSKNYIYGSTSEVWNNMITGDKFQEEAKEKKKKKL